MLPEQTTFGALSERLISAHAYMVLRWLGRSTLEELEQELDELAGSESQAARDAERIIESWIRRAFKVTGCEGTPEEER